MKRKAFPYTVLICLLLLPFEAGAVKHIFRSVQRSITGKVDTAAGTNNLTISSDTATFGSALQDTAGVGDALLYDTDDDDAADDAICFLTKRIPGGGGKKWIVKTAAGGTPTAVSGDNAWSLFRAYISLVNAETGTENTGILAGLRDFDTWTTGRDIDANDETWNIACYRSDLVGFTVSGWTTASDNYLNIFVPDNDTLVGLTQRHSGTFSTTNTTYMQHASGNFVGVYSNFVRIDGLQFNCTNVTSNSLYIVGNGLSGDGDFRISNCIFLGDSGTDAAIQRGIYFYSNNSDFGVRVWNCLFRNLGRGTNDDGIILWDDLDSCFIYNNTFNGCRYSIRCNTSQSIVVKNNLVFEGASLAFSGTFADASGYNASDAASIPGSNNITLPTSTLTDYVTSVTDFHINTSELKSDSLVGRGASLWNDDSLPVRIDIDGQTRPMEGNYDIGCDGYNQEIVTIEATDDTGTEASTTTATFTVTRNKTSGSRTVNFTVSGTATDTDDYSTIGTSVTIDDGNATATVTITPVDDSDIEGDETVTLTLASGTGYLYGYPNTATATITDNETTVSISATDATATEASATTGTFTVTRGPGTSGNLDVDYTVTGSATSGDDFTALTGSVTVSDGNATATITVTPVDDSDGEGDETVFVTVDDGTGYAAASGSTAVVTITDDDDVPVYYSVGTSTDDLKSGSPTVTIASGVATFSSAQPGYVGVGDFITHEPDNQRCVIYGRTNSTTYKVRTSVGNTPDRVSAQTVNSIKRAFNSLDLAVDAGASTSDGQGADDTLGTADLTSSNGYILNLACYGHGTNDGTSAIVTGWTTGADNYIRLYTPTDATEVGTRQRHDGYWNTDKYYLEKATGYNLDIQEDHVRVDGLQLRVSNVSGNSYNLLAYDRGATADIRISNCIIRGDNKGTASHKQTGIYIYNTNGSETYRIWNNIIHDHLAGTSSQGGISVNSTNACYAYIYNNTIARVIYGILTGTGATNKIAINNFCQTSNTSFVFDFDAASSNNAGNIGTVPGSSPLTLSSASESDYFNGSADYRLNDQADYWYELNNGGTDLSEDANLSFSTDAADSSRPYGVSWDIGANEYRGSTADAKVIYRSVGTSTADLSAGTRTVEIVDTIATFSAAMPDTVGVGDVLQYQVSGSYTVAFIHGRNSTTEYVVKSRSGDTPTQCNAGTSVGVYRAYTDLYSCILNTEGQANSGIHADADDLVPLPSFDLTALNARFFIAGYADGNTSNTGWDLIYNWTTSASNYIKVYAPFLTSEVGESQRHTGSWTNTGWTLVNTDNYVIRIDVTHCRLEGLQIQGTHSAGASGHMFDLWLYGPSQDGEIWTSDCLFDGTNSTATSKIHYCFGQYSVEGDFDWYFFNNVFFDYTDVGGRNNDAQVSCYVYNNTFVDCDIGYSAEAGATIMKNNVFLCPNGISGSTGLTQTFCASEVASECAIDLTSGTVTDYFVSDAAGSEDYHIDPEATYAHELIDAGTDLSADGNFAFATDIDDSTRPIPAGGSWDLGADEYQPTSYFDSLSWATTATTCSVWTDNWRLVFDEDGGGGITQLRNGSAVDATDQLSGTSHTLFDAQYYGASTWLMSGGSGTLTVTDTGYARVVLENQRTILTDQDDAIMNIRYTVWCNGHIAIKAKVTNNTGSSMTSDMGFYAWMRGASATDTTDWERSAQKKWVGLSEQDGEIDPVLAPYDTSGWGTLVVPGTGASDSAGYEVTMALADEMTQEWQFHMDVGHKDWGSAPDSTNINRVVDAYQRPDSLTITQGANVLEQAWEEYLHAHWPFNEGSGTDVLDYSGNNIDGTNTGATYTTGKFSAALQFTNTENDKVQINNSGLLNAENKHTICAWIYLDNFGEGSQGAILDKADAFSLYVDGTGTKDSLCFKAARWNTTDGLWHTAPVAGDLLTSTWYHVAVTYDYSGGTGEDPIIYLNGVQMALNEIATPAGTAADESNSLYIGNNSGTTADFGGKIADVRFYADELTDDDIMAIANNNWDAGRGGYRVRANANSIITLKINGSNEQRVQPAFVLGNWWHNNLPAYAYLDGTQLTFGSDYLADVDSTNHRLYFRLNKTLGGSSHELNIDDSDPESEAKTQMAKMYYSTTGDVITIKNFDGDNLGSRTSGEWAFEIDDGSDAAGDRIAKNFVTAVIDPNTAYSGATAQLTTMDYFYLTISGNAISELTDAPTGTGTSSNTQSTAFFQYDSDVKTHSNTTSFIVRRKITVYPTGRVFYQTIINPSAAITEGTGSEQRLVAVAGAIHANTNPIGLDSAIHHDDSTRYHFSGTGKQSFATGVLGVKYNPTPTQSNSYLIAGSTPTSNKIYTSSNVLGMGLSATKVPADGCTLAYFMDFSVPMWLNATQRDSFVNDLQYPDALTMISGGGSVVTNDQGDLDGDGFNEGEGCYVLDADGNSENTVHFIIDTGTTSPGVAHYYPAFKIESYTSARAPAYVFVDSAAQTEGYDYNVYVNNSDDELIIQFNHVVRDKDTIYISAATNLAVKLDAFLALAGDKNDTLVWRTQSEEGNAGFNLYRRIKPSWWLAKTRKLRKVLHDAGGSEKTAVFKDKWDNDTTWQIVNMRGIIPGAKGGRSSTTRDYRFIDIRVENDITYEYRLEDLDFGGKRRSLGMAEATPHKQIPKKFALHGNFPNPFNPVTFIRYDLPVKCHVDLTVYNLRGQRIATLLSRQQEPGYYHLTWNGKDHRGRSLASGVYYYRIKARKFVKTRRMVLVK